MDIDIVKNLLTAFSVAFQLNNLFFCFVGVTIGTLIGVLPGLGPVATLSILLPVTFRMDPVTGIIMLAGIYYGAQYGGSTTSILVNIPGEASSVVTCIDGYRMACAGRAGAALAIAAIGSFIAGTLATFLIVLVAPILTQFALKFGAPEYFSLLMLGLMMVSYLGTGSWTKAMMASSLGLFLSTVGTHLISGTERFTFQSYTLKDGLGLVPLVMGLFGIAEVVVNVEEGVNQEILKGKVGSLFPNKEEWRRSRIPILRGSLVGFFLGILPGGGAVLASFASYAVEHRFSKRPEEFGRGAIEGVAGPEAANNAASQASFIPLLSLGIPANVVTAVLLGALLMHGVTVGPLLAKLHPNLFWGVIGSMYVGNAMLLILNLPLIGIWVKLLEVPYKILFPIILVLCIIGVYSLNNNIVEIFIMNIFGLLGYLMKKYDYEAAPLILAFILGPIIEKNLGQSLMMSQGSFLIFLTRPISCIFVVTGIGLLFVAGMQALRKSRRTREKMEASRENKPSKMDSVDSSA